MAKTNKEVPEEALEKKLWKAADKLRKNMDAAEYKHVALGLIFLNSISFCHPLPPLFFFASRTI